MSVEATVCKVVDLHEIPTADAARLKFRIEVRKLQDRDLYDAVVYRLESFKLTTSFVEDSDGKRFAADHQLFIVDESLDPRSFRSMTPDETIRRVEAALDKQLGR